MQPKKPMSTAVMRLETNWVSWLHHSFGNPCAHNASNQTQVGLPLSTIGLANLDIAQIAAWLNHVKAAKQCDIFHVTESCQ